MIRRLALRAGSPIWSRGRVWMAERESWNLDSREGRRGGRGEGEVRSEGERWRVISRRTSDLE